MTEEQAGQFFIVNAGGLRLCVDLAHEVSSGPTIGFKVASVKAVLEALAKRGIKSEHEPVSTAKGAWTEIRDSDGRIVILTEND